MNTSMKINTSQVIKHWERVEPWVTIPRNNTEYEKALKAVSNLMEILRHKDDRHAASLLRFIAKNIEKYEKTIFPMEESSPVEVLKFLMEEHNLTQSDLSDEIGSQSLISKILKGERKLTVEHIVKLAKRFNVSPTVFLP